MEIITTHLNADFDAFASMVAAKKLYPDAVVAFPGAQEKNLRDFFIESTLYILSIERAKDIDLDEVTRLILVDTRQKSRIGRFSALVDAKDVEIHIYDHHPDSEDDVKGHMEIVEDVGAAVTLLIEEIRKRGVELNAEEATVLALGIYEDTGSFAFSSTTPRDFNAAGWLLSRGANLNIISNMMTSDVSTDQIELLHRLIEGSELVNLGGVEVLVTTASSEHYVGDLAVLVHKYRDMENPEAIFAIVRMEDRVHLIGRSSAEEVNAGEIAAEFGGGGHPTAASATIRNLSLYEVRENLIGLLHERVRPKRKAGQIMSRPVISIGPDQRLSEAAEYLSRYQISSLPVVQNGCVMGILHRNAVEKALHHGLDEQLVADYMNPGVVFVTPDETIDRVLSITVEGRHRLVPVVDEGNMVGVISRSDLLEHLKLPLRSDTTGPDEFPSGRVRSKSVRRLMEERFPTRVMDILKRAGDVADTRGENAYLVGGAVRDLLLRIHNLDLDIVVEGNGIDFSRELAEQFTGCRVRSHEKFGTAVMLFQDGFKIDTATARHEYYSVPGALPTVETSSIKRDLYRRDFTMNTLAVRLNPRSFGQVIDFFGGSRDIKERTIRVLHNLAFVEDPTRIMRAARFSSRFGFAIGKHTLTLMKGAVRMNVFDKVEGKRLLNELIHALDERNPMAPLTLMAGFGILKALHPSLQFGPRTAELLESATAVLSWWKYQFFPDEVETWTVYFLALADSLTDEEFDALVRRLSIVRAKRKDLLRQRQEVSYVLGVFAKGEATRPSRVVEALQKLQLEALLFMMAKTVRESTRKALSEYITTLRHVIPKLTGRDLLQMDYEPGPLFGEMLRTLRNARLDGLVSSADDEVELLKKMYPVEPGQSPPVHG
ncbi:MAG: CBS domain-containing protein [Desulfomonilaceae bacterium]|nr:CBS domain-containing protein [Desulfomonilaceae bacterium]